MGGLFDDIIRVDWDQVRFRQAVSGLLAMVAVVALLRLAGGVVFAGLLATLFVTTAGGVGTVSQRLPGMVRFTALGALLGGLAYWSAESAFAVALVLGIATYVGTVAAAAGPIAARSGLFLTLWVLFALMLGAADTTGWAVSVAFLVGGGVAIAVTILRLWITADDEAGDPDEPDPQDVVLPEGESRMALFVAVATTPLGWFAVLRTVAVVLAVVVGFWFFESHPLWVAITVIVVVKPSSRQSVSAVVQRTLGTAVGVAIAVGVAQFLPRGDLGVVVAFLASGFLMVAFFNANYTLFATFLTAMLVFGQRLVQADAFQAGGWERLLATIVGAMIALGVIAIAAAVGPARVHRTELVPDPDDDY